MFTEPGWNMHTPAQIGIDDFQADRSPDGHVPDDAARRALGTRTKGGFYHDGRFATLGQVVQHYNSCFEPRADRPASSPTWSST